MGRGSRIVPLPGAGERGGEAFVERLDRNVHRTAQLFDEPVRLSAWAPTSPRSVKGSPTTIRSASSSRTRPRRRANPSSDAAPSIVQSGRAIVPVGSETATPVRAEP